MNYFPKVTMPSERGEEPWVDEMDGPERLARAKKRRTEQLERWGRRENTTGDEGKKRRKKDKTLKFKPNIVILEAAARNDLEEGLSFIPLLQCNISLTGKCFEG